MIHEYYNMLVGYCSIFKQPVSYYLAHGQQQLELESCCSQILVSGCKLAGIDDGQYPSFEAYSRTSENDEAIPWKFQGKMGNCGKGIWGNAVRYLPQTRKHPIQVAHSQLVSNINGLDSLQLFQVFM